MTKEELKIDRARRWRWYRKQAKLAKKKTVKYLLRRIIKVTYGN